MKRAFCLVLALSLLLSIGTSVMAQPKKYDSKIITLDVTIGPWAEIEIDNGTISLDLTQPGQRKRGTTPFTVKTNTDVIVTFADYFPRLILRTDDKYRSFKDPGTPEWSNALKSKVWIAKSADGRPWDDGLGERMPVTGGRTISRWVNLEAHWDDRDVVEPGWWNAIAGSYTGTVVLVIEAPPIN